MKAATLFRPLAAALLLSASVFAQQPATAGGRFQKDGLSFDYSPGWTLSDKSGEQVQDVSVTAPGGRAFVRVIVHREPLQTAAQLGQLRDVITTPFVEALARSLGLEKAPPWQESQCITLGGRFANGFKMAGRLQGRPATAEVYTIVLGQRLVHLVYVRDNEEEAASAPVWQSVLDTLKVEPPADPSPGAEKFDRLVMGGVLNGRVLKKPAPNYPLMAKSNRSQGMVVVRVVVDENGEVASAQAIQGHPDLRAASESAARQAKFAPTLLCGRPVRVSGIITYNFVLR